MLKNIIIAIIFLKLIQSANILDNLQIHTKIGQVKTFQLSNTNQEKIFAITFDFFKINKNQITSLQPVGVKERLNAQMIAKMRQYIIMKVISNKQLITICPFNYQSQLCIVQRSNIIMDIQIVCLIEECDGIFTFYETSFQYIQLSNDTKSYNNSMALIIQIANPRFQKAAAQISFLKQQQKFQDSMKIYSDLLLYKISQPQNNQLVVAFTQRKVSLFIVVKNQSIKKQSFKIKLIIQPLSLNPKTNNNLLVFKGQQKKIQFNKNLTWNQKYLNFRANIYIMIPHVNFINKSLILLDHNLNQLFEFWIMGQPTYNKTVNIINDFMNLKTFKVQYRVTFHKMKHLYNLALLMIPSNCHVYVNFQFDTNPYYVITNGQKVYFSFFIEQNQPEEILFVYPPQKKAKDNQILIIQGTQKNKLILPEKKCIKQLGCKFSIRGLQKCGMCSVKFDFKQQKQIINIEKQIMDETQQQDRQKQNNIRIAQKLFILKESLIIAIFCIIMQIIKRKLIFR